MHATGTLAGLINSRSLGDTIGASCGVICEADVKRIEFRPGPMVFNDFDPCISLDYWGLVNLGVSHPKFNGYARLLKWIEVDICWYRCVALSPNQRQVVIPGPRWSWPVLDLPGERINSCCCALTEQFGSSCWGFQLHHFPINAQWKVLGNSGTQK